MPVSTASPSEPQPSPAQQDPTDQRPEPTPAQIRRWRRYLADELTEGAIYEALAKKAKSPEDARILTALAEAEERHADHWRALLGEHAKPSRPSIQRSLLRFLATHFGSIFVLALVQRAEGNNPYAKDSDVPSKMAADELVHEEVVRGLATEGRMRLSGNFRAAVFGANDGLVSNFALVLGIGATGVAPSIVMFTGIAGLLAGALSMGAGEFVSIRSQRELLDASRPTHATLHAAPHLDLDENELVLVYLARGMSQEAAEHRAAERMGRFECDCDPSTSLPLPHEGRTLPGDEELDGHGSAWGAATSSFVMFSIGAIVPILPYIFRMTGIAAVIIATILVSAALLITGGFVGLISGSSPVSRGFRQLFIGLGAAAVTYVLGLLFGTVAL